MVSPHFIRGEGETQIRHSGRQMALRGPRLTARICDCGPVCGKRVSADGTQVMNLKVGWVSWLDGWVWINQRALKAGALSLAGAAEMLQRRFKVQEGSNAPLQALRCTTQQGRPAGENDGGQRKPATTGGPERPILRGAGFCQLLKSLQMHSSQIV